MLHRVRQFLLFWGVSLRCMSPGQHDILHNCLILTFSAFMFNRVPPFLYCAECHYAECCHANITQDNSQIVTLSRAFMIHRVKHFFSFF